MANNNHFQLTLDTLAPTGSISRPAQYVNDQTTCSIVKGDATFMYAWFDTNAAGTLPANPTWVDADNSVDSSFDADGVYYGHVCLMDDVNNKSVVYNTQSITYDVTPPQVKDMDKDGKAVDITLRDGTKTEITKTREVAITFEFDDNLSGVVSYTLSGDLASTVIKTGTLTAEEINAHKATRDIVLSGTGPEDHQKTVSVTVTDNSGNTSLAVSDSIILDTEFLTGNIILKQGAKQINSQWTNTAPVTVELALSSATEDDVVAYKIFGAGLADPDTNWVTVTKGSDISVEKNFSTGDSDNKVVEAMVRDDAGNVTTLTSVFAKVDYTRPTVSIAIKSGETQYVSKVSGFTTKDLVPTVDASISGVASYTWKMNGNTYQGGTGTTDPTEFQVDSANMGEGGAKVAKSFTLTVVDNAGNTATSEPVVVYLDTVAPTGSITMPAWLNGDAADQTTYKKFSTAGATASATDGGAGLAYMTCWCSQTAADTTVVGTQIAYKANPTHADIDWTKHAESTTNYIHIKYVDAVGNAAIIHSAAFGIDTQIPDVGVIAFSKPVYNTQAASVTLTRPQSIAPITRMRITGNIDNGTSTLSEKYTDDKGAVWEAFAGTRSVTLHKEQTPQPSINRSAEIVFYDEAGNFGVTPYASATTELDMVGPSAQLTLFNKNNDAAQPPTTKERGFNVHITGHEDKGAPANPANLEYLLYGDFALTEEAAIAGQGVTEATAVWTKVTAWDTGKDFKTVGLLYATNPDGEKQVYLKLRDNAGNVTTATPVSFEFDTVPPVVTVANIDHNRISKIHELRLTHQEHETRHYADETKFTFSSDSTFQAYKVCAYLNETAAREDYPGDTARFERDEWVEAQVAIPTTAGSINMSATGLTQTQPVSCTIKGADYEAALGNAGTVDGAHFVVVYVQDLGGSWSVAASFEA